MTLTFNKEAALNHMADVAARGVDRSTDRMLEVALKHAPVRKDRARRKLAREDSVRVLKQDFIPDRKRFAQVVGGETRPVVSSVRKFRQLRAQGLRPDEAGKGAVSRRGAGSFTFSFVNDKSNHEEFNIGFNPRRGLTAKAAVRGGNLKSKIRKTRTVRDGHKVSGSIVSLAPYSNVVEFGFIHVGGKRVPAQPFMRPAKADLQTNWRQNFRSGR